MEMNEVILEIRWTIQDVFDAFVREYSREPSERELAECVELVESASTSKSIEEGSFEVGWANIERVIRGFRQYQESK